MGWKLWLNRNLRNPQEQDIPEPVKDGTKPVKVYPVEHLFVGECKNYHEIFDDVMICYNRIDCFLFDDIEHPTRAKKITGRNDLGVSKLYKDESKESGGYIECAQWVNGKVVVNRFSVGRLDTLKANQGLWNKYAGSSLTTQKFLDADKIAEVFVRINAWARQKAMKQARIDQRTREIIEAEFGEDE